MHTVERDDFPDEKPTTPTAHVPTPMLAFARRVQRLAEIATERLECEPDGCALASAIVDLAQIRALALEVQR